jgi:hypothetical protein
VLIYHTCMLYILEAVNKTSDFLDAVRSLNIFSYSYAKYSLIIKIFKTSVKNVSTT